MTSKFRKTVDWDAMRSDWVAGIKSVLQLSSEYDVSRAAILKHWKNAGVERNLADKIKAKADALVTRASVTHEVTSNNGLTESEIINANAQNNAAIQINERKDVTRSRNIVMKLVDELEEQIDCKEEYIQLGEILRNPDQNGNDKLNDIYMKVISLPGRVDSVKKLSDSLKTLIELERKVYKIDGDDSGGTFEDWLKKQAKEA